MSKRCILAVFSDPHAGSEKGLCNPETIIYDVSEEGDLIPKPVTIGAAQEILWPVYLEAVSKTGELAGDDPVVLAMLGDPTQGVFLPEELATNRMANQVLMARGLFEPWLGLPQLRVIRLSSGTGVHEMGGSSASILLAHDLQRTTELDVAVHYHELVTINGGTVDMTHHGPGDSSRVWLHGNTPRYYLRDLMMRHLQSLETPPQLVLRGHVHVRVNEVVTVWAGDTCYESRIVIVPPMCFMNDYARRRTRSIHEIVFGVVLFEIVDGMISAPIFITRTMDVRRRERLL